MPLGELVGTTLQEITGQELTDGHSLSNIERLVCCLKGMWVHPYTVTLAKLALDLGILGSLEEWQ